MGAFEDLISPKSKSPGAAYKNYRTIFETRLEYLWKKDAWSVS